MKEESKKRKFFSYFIFMLLLSSLFVLAVSNFQPQQTLSNYNGINYNSEVCISTTGDFDGRTLQLGEMETIQCESNLVVNAGLEAIEDALNGASVGTFNYIGLCNASAGCTTPVIGDTTIDNEYSAGGLTRATGTFLDLGTGNWSRTKTFTATANNLLTNVTGIFNASSSGTLLAQNSFTLVTLQTNDQLKLNWTIFVT